MRKQTLYKIESGRARDREGVGKGRIVWMNEQMDEQYQESMAICVRVGEKAAQQENEWNCVGKDVLWP